MMRICLATENKGKVAEIQSLLDGLPVTIVTSKDLGIDMDVAETGKTYQDNAYLKASAYAVKTGLPCLGDDSGLEVAALDGAPGLYSNRYAPVQNPTDRDRRIICCLSWLTNPDPGPPSSPARSAFAIPMAGTGSSMAGAMARSFRRNGEPMASAMTRSFKWPGWQKPWLN